MSVGHTVLTGEVACGSAFDVLARLAAASRTPRAELPSEVASALDMVGDAAGETWLNLLGVPLDAGAPFGVERLLDALETLDPIELRRHLLGRYAWSWCTLAGADDIDAAAAGDDAAVERLLAHERYYAGQARAALGTLLPLDPAETQRRIVAAVGAARALVEPAAADALEAAGDAAATVLSAEPLIRAVEQLTRGYRYVPELEAERLVLVPHLEPKLSLVLAQHRAARVVLYPVLPDRAPELELLTLGRALADPKRVEILAFVGRGVGRASDLVTETGLTRSTVHHHLAQLRDAGLVALEGNARAYTYVPRRGAAADAAALVAKLTGTEED